VVAPLNVGAHRCHVSRFSTALGGFHEHEDGVWAVRCRFPGGLAFGLRGGTESAVTPVAPTPTGTLAASAAQCSVAADRTSCRITLTATTKDVTSAEGTDGDGKRYAVTLNAAATLQVDLKPGDERSFSLSYGGSAATEAVVVRGVCATGVYLDNRGVSPVCAAVLNYENTVYGEANGTKNSVRFQGDTCATVEVAENATPYQQNEVQLADRLLYNKVLPSGRILVNALVTEKNLAEEVFVLNPVTNATTQYDGSEGPAPALTDPGWIDVSPALSGEIGKHAETRDLLIYVSTKDSRVVYCQDKTTGQVTTLPGTSERFQYRAFVAYRN
jgi:hypothetical protein